MDAAHNVCFHLIEYFDKLKQDEKTKINLQSILSIGVASIFSYFLQYYKEDFRIYYKESSHPHPMVRISYIVDCFIRVSEINLPGNFVVDSKQTLKDGIIIAEIFYKTNQKAPLVKDFADQFMEESYNIEKYVNDLLGIADSMRNLVKNKH